MNEVFDFLDLLSIKKLSETKLYLLLEKYKSPGNIKAADRNELISLVGSEIAHHIKNISSNHKQHKNFRELIEKLRIKVIPYYSKEYPVWLKQIPHFPPVIFVRGEILKEDEVSVAIIGTRGATVYGKEIARDFAGRFVDCGVTVVSGMARGIDTQAHWGALKNGGRTIAVLGCGVDICYPPENRKLMEEIIKNGAVISEFTLNTPPLAQNFPKRNRIISGLARAVVAIEAKERSGVMNTVRWALDQNKEVFAIPGNIYARTSKGTNLLIKEGAIPVTSADEVLEYLGIQHTKAERQAKEVLLDEKERLVWDELSFEPIYLDILSERLNQSTGTILEVLLGLEMKGLIRQLPGMMFVKNFDTQGR